jgi:hypothetical protein
MIIFLTTCKNKHMNNFWIFLLLCWAGWQVWARLKQRTKPPKFNSIFDGNYIDAQAFYLHEYGTLPCKKFVKHIDVEKAYQYLSNGNAGKVMAIYQNEHYHWQQQEQVFSCAIFKMQSNMLIELGPDYAEILFDQTQYAEADQLLAQFVTLRAAEKEVDFEINIITPSGTGLDVKPLRINPTTLDIGLYYNDDFKAVHELILKRLLTPSDKGIVLLHGLPGTGKTTYLRHLVGSLNKKVLFVPAGVAENLMNPELMDLLLEYPNAVLVIEDAETVITTRKFNTASGVSTLLNISDGLLSDCLNVQIICTFNSALSTVDSALLRKGRLIATYEFGKLTVEKSRRLSAHFGFDNTIDTPMTLAEISNPQAADAISATVQVIGFRRPQLMMN